MRGCKVITNYTETLKTDKWRNIVKLDLINSIVLQNVAPEATRFLYPSPDIESQFGA